MIGRRRRSALFRADNAAPDTNSPGVWVEAILRPPAPRKVVSKNAGGSLQDLDPRLESARRRLRDLLALEDAVAGLTARTPIQAPGDGEVPLARSSPPSYTRDEQGTHFTYEEIFGEDGDAGVGYASDTFADRWESRRDARESRQSAGSDAGTDLPAGVSEPRTSAEAGNGSDDGDRPRTPAAIDDIVEEIATRAAGSASTGGGSSPDVLEGTKDALFWGALASGLVEGALRSWLRVRTPLAATVGQRATDLAKYLAAARVILELMTRGLAGPFIPSVIQAELRPKVDPTDPLRPQVVDPEILGLLARLLVWRMVDLSPGAERRSDPRTSNPAPDADSTEYGEKRFGGPGGDIFSPFPGDRDSRAGDLPSTRPNYGDDGEWGTHTS